MPSSACKKDAGIGDRDRVADGVGVEGRGALADRQRGAFFFNDTATTEIYTLSLHDALPISDAGVVVDVALRDVVGVGDGVRSARRQRGDRRVGSGDLGVGDRKIVV